MMLLGLLAAAADGSSSVAPREISGAERQAVALAVAYFEGGAEAWWKHLSVDAPIRRLGREDAVAEIAVRLGPGDGAVWRLQTPGTAHGDTTAIFVIEFPSGIEEIVRLELVEEDGWKIREIFSLADPTPVRTDFRGAAAPPRGDWRITWPVVLALIAGCITAWLALPRGKRLAVRWALCSLSVASLALAACRGRETPPASDGQAGQPEGPVARLASLMPLREALAGGIEAVSEVPVEGASASATASAVVQLWKAQYYLVQRNLSAAQEIFDTLPSVSELPLDSLLRARFTLLLSQISQTEMAFDWALRHVADHDGFRAEAALAYGALGFIEKTDTEFRQLRRMGSRMADVYYVLASLGVMTGEDDLAEEDFRTGWQLRPLEREALFRSPSLAAVCARAPLFPLFRFHSPEEPVVLAEGARKPLAALAGKPMKLLGEQLSVEVGGGEVVVPGGAVLAPESTPQEDAAAHARREEEEALTAVDSLLKKGLPGFTQPIRHRQLMAAAEALGEDRRWEELLQLTEGLGLHVELAPPSLVQLRARALIEMKRAGEARRLLIELAQSDAANRRRDPATFYQLAELMAEAEEYDLAIRLIEKAHRLSPWPRSDARIRQLRMEKRLKTSFREHRTRHFVLHYPASTEQLYPDYLGVVLEEEYERLRRWIPLATTKAIDVDLFPFDEFMASYSQGVRVLGIFDGRVRVPFADVHSLQPLVVSVFSHEVAHAMIDEYTGDQAPKWFHEGLAQHVEMVHGSMNPMPDLLAASHTLAFPLIESVLKGFSEPQLVDVAYSEAAWILHFIEERYGVRGIHRMLDAYRSGYTTDEALGRAFGVSAAKLERAAWNWARSEAPAVWATEVRRYDQDFNPYVMKRSVAEALPRKKSVSRVGKKKPAPARMSALESSMKQWHATYASRVEPVKAALIPVVATFRDGGQRPDDIAMHCRQLFEMIDPILNQGVLDAPDGLVANRLRKAYQSFRAMAMACRGGRDAAVRSNLRKAEEGLVEAARVMDRYGLEP